MTPGFQPVKIHLKQIQKKLEDRSGYVRIIASLGNRGIQS